MRQIFEILVQGLKKIDSKVFENFFKKNNIRYFDKNLIFLFQEFDCIFEQVISFDDFELYFNNPIWNI